MSEQRRTGIILGEYKGLQVPGFDRTITDEDVMESLRRLQAQNVYHQEVEGRPVQNGDIATIDYEGFYKGKPFQGGKGSEYPLEIEALFPDLKSRSSVICPARNLISK